MPDIQLCEDCARVAEGDDWTIVDQATAERVERWQATYTARPAYDTDTGNGVTTSGTACHCCGTRQAGLRYAFRATLI